MIPILLSFGLFKKPDSINANGLETCYFGRFNGFVNYALKRFTNEIKQSEQSIKKFDQILKLVAEFAEDCETYKCEIVLHFCISIDLSLQTLQIFLCI